MNEEICTRDCKEAVEAKQLRKMPYGTDDAENVINFQALLRHLVQYTNISSIVSNIKKGTQYTVQVPTHLQAMLESGDLSMLHGESSGQTWATIVKKAENGKQEFVANCPIKEEAFYPNNPIQNLASGFAAMQMQRQIEELALKLEETYSAVLRVEAGQKADRIGQLNAGRDGIIHALRVKDGESRKLAITVARGSLLEAQGKIAETLRQKIMAFKPVPAEGFPMWFALLKDSNCLDKRDDEYNAIQDYFELYMQATALIAESFMICGETEGAMSTWDVCQQFVESLDFGKMKTILHSHPNRTADTLFFNSALPNVIEYRTLCLESAKAKDYLEITFEGEEILEALEHEQ